jgi:hypothetical protein
MPRTFLHLLLSFVFVLAFAGCPASDDDDDATVDDDDTAPDDDDTAPDDDDTAPDDDDTAPDDDDTAPDDDDTAPDDDDSADDDDAADDDDDSAHASTVSFADDVLPIITANCSCHGSPPGSGGWNHQNDAATLYAAWVNHAASGLASMSRIEPGERATSYVWHKLNGTQASVGGVGSQMPLTGPPYLGTSDLDTIGTWIDEGAQNN